MATLTLPRVATHKINYSTGEAWTQGADAAVYCSAKYKNMAQWQYDLTALQTERAGRDIIITRATVSWSTSAKYTYDIRVQNERCYGRNWGVYLGDAKGSSVYSHWISTSRSAPHDSITLIQNTINSGATAIYVSCQNESTSASGYGKCEYGTFSIEYEYATPRTVIEYLVADKTMIALGETVDVSASIRNTTESEISAVQLQVVREVDGADVAVGDAVSVDVTIPAAETAQISKTLTIPAWTNAARATQLYVQVSISGADAEKTALCTALDKRYNPTIETFNVSRATQHPIDGWIKSDNGMNTTTDLKIGLGSGATGFTMKVYYGTGEVDVSTAQSIDLTSKISDAIAGLTNAIGLVEKTDGWALGNTWNFLLVLSDGYESVQASAQIEIAFTNMHLAGLTTGGVRFGGYCERSTQGKPAFECDYPIYADGGIPSLDYSTTETKMPYKWIDGKTIYRRVFVAENVTDADYVFADAIEGLETVAAVAGMFYNQYGQFKIPYMTSGEGWASVLVRPTKQVLVQSSGGFDIDKVVVVVDYTKGA